MVFFVQFDRLIGSFPPLLDWSPRAPFLFLTFFGLRSQVCLSLISLFFPYFFGAKLTSTFSFSRRIKKTSRSSGITGGRSPGLSSPLFHLDSRSITAFTHKHQVHCSLKREPNFTLKSDDKFNSGLPFCPDLIFLNGCAQSGQRNGCSNFVTHWLMTFFRRRRLLRPLCSKVLYAGIRDGLF